MFVGLYCSTRPCGTLQGQERIDRARGAYVMTRKAFIYVIIVRAFVRSSNFGNLRQCSNTSIFQYDLWIHTNRIGCFKIMRKTKNPSETVYELMVFQIYVLDRAHTNFQSERESWALFSARDLCSAEIVSPIARTHAQCTLQEELLLTQDHSFQRR